MGAQRGHGTRLVRVGAGVIGVDVLYRTPVCSFVLRPPMAWRRALDQGDGTYANPQVYQRWLMRASRDVGRAWRGEAASKPEPLNCPLEVGIVVYLERPQRRPGAYPADLWGAVDAPAIGRADVDNFAASVLDACTRAGVWVDDTRVSSLVAAKFWLSAGETDQRIEVTISKIGSIF
jgi:Holliday junction resolvase RusA-like endonuclease